MDGAQLPRGFGYDHDTAPWGSLTNYQSTYRYMGSQRMMDEGAGRDGKEWERTRQTVGCGI